MRRSIYCLMVLIERTHPRVKRNAVLQRSSRTGRPSFAMRHRIICLRVSVCSLPPNGRQSLAGSGENLLPLAHSWSPNVNSF